MLVRLLGALDRRRFRAQVLSLTDLGAKSDEIRALGIPVEAVGMKRVTPNPMAMLRLMRFLRASKPDIVHTWMYHADLAGGLAARLATRSSIIWCVRHGVLDDTMGRRTRAVVRLCAMLSAYVPDRIVMCSQAAREAHVYAGYEPGRICVIPNGVDLSRFAPSDPARHRVRHELRVPVSALVGIHVARLDPQKDHQNLIKSCAVVMKSVPNFYLIMCGDGITDDNRWLAQALADAGVPRERVRLLGRRNDVADLFNAADVAVSSSFGESFPNVLAEAMACGIPCVTTDVGDSAYIVGDTGRIVPPRDVAALGAAIIDLLSATREAKEALRRSTRARVQSLFDIREVASMYQNLYHNLAGPRFGRGATA